MIQRRRWEPGIVILLLVIAAGGCCLPIIQLEENWYKSHEYERYLHTFHHFREAFLEGNLYPRWLANFYGGYGYPTFVYYQPGFFHAAIPFSLVLPYPFVSMKVTIGFFFFLGGLGAFLLTRRLTGSTLFGLFGALCFLLTPYVCTNVYVRGDLSEFAAMMITPWPCYYVLRARRLGRLDGQSVLVFVGLTASLACLFCMHPATALFYPVVFGLFTLGCLDSYKRQQVILLLVCLAFLSGLVISSPYWLTVWQMREYVDLSRLHEEWYNPTGHLVNPKQFIWSEWKYGASPGGLPLQLGWPHLLLAIGGVVVARRLRLTKFSAATYCGLILAMTLVGYPLWRYLPLLKFVQFPWRMLSVVALVQLICISGLWRLLAIRGGKVRSGILLVLALVMVLLARHQFQFESVRDVDKQEILASSQSPFTDFQSYSALDDYLPQTVLERPSAPRIDDSMVQLYGNGTLDIEPLPGHSPYHLRVRIVTADDPTSVVIGQFYFPGMKVLIDGCRLSSAEVSDLLLEDGRMVVALVSSSDVVLEVYYDGPPGWRFHFVVIALWFITLGLIAANKWGKNVLLPTSRKNAGFNDG